MTDVMNLALQELDPEVQAVLDAELTRQRDTLEMIASENFVPRAVLQCQGSVLTNKYAEGYPWRLSAPRPCSERITPMSSLTLGRKPMRRCCTR